MAPPVYRRAFALSQALTYPLTVAAALASLSLTEPPRRVCLIGARGEATLPAYFWSEVRVLLGSPELRLDFIGPKAAVWPGAANPDPSTVLLHPARGELFHESALGARLLRVADAGGAESGGAGAEGAAASDGAADLPDAFVCLNPGFGYPGWEHAWAPTLRALRISRRPVVLSALGAADAERDGRFWESALGEKPPDYRPNPWASLVDTSAPGEPASRANALVALVGSATCGGGHHLSMRSQDGTD